MKDILRTRLLLQNVWKSLALMVAHFLGRRRSTDFWWRSKFCTIICLIIFWLLFVLLLLYGSAIDAAGILTDVQEGNEWDTKLDVVFPLKYLNEVETLLRCFASLTSKDHSGSHKKRNSPLSTANLRLPYLKLMIHYKCPVSPLIVTVI